MQKDSVMFPHTRGGTAYNKKSDMVIHIFLPCRLCLAVNATTPVCHRAHDPKEIHVDALREGYRVRMCAAVVLPKSNAQIEKLQNKQATAMKTLVTSPWYVRPIT